jgi:hypothetical protein
VLAFNDYAKAWRCSAATRPPILATTQILAQPL